MSRRRAEARKWALQAGPSTLSTLAPAPIDDPIEQLIARAQKAKSKSDARRAIVLLRQACALDEWRARTWTLLAVLLAEEGVCGEASQAFKHARWLRLRAGETARAAVTERLAARLAAAA
jgi:Flp pilus assembly protein TadD